MMELYGDISSCMEILLKQMLRKVRGGYLFKFICFLSRICVVYLVFRKLYIQYNIFFV